MSLATFQNPPFEDITDPSVGIVCGHAWGESVEVLLLDHPEAQLVEDEADIQEYVVPKPFGFCGLETYIFFRYQLDVLIAISLRWGLSEEPLIDEACARCVASYVQRTFSEELVESDEGFFQAEELSTRLMIDWMDNRLVFEEVL